MSATIRQEMSAAAARGAEPLGDARDGLRQFTLGQITPAGGFSDRAGQGDLYYTVFGLGCLEALDCPPPESVGRFLDGFGDGEGLDLVHLASLIRCRAILGGGFADGPGRPAALLTGHRSADGGYSLGVGRPVGQVYACFLALGAMQDLGLAVENPLALAASVSACRAEGGGFANAPLLPAGAATTAAAVMLLRHLHRPVGGEATAWLLSRARRDGGFAAAATAPAADLLSTATAAMALAATSTALPAPVRARTLEFVRSLWDRRGGFRAHSGDDRLDCEHTFYGLLALGCLGPK